MLQFAQTQELLRHDSAVADRADPGLPEAGAELVHAAVEHRLDPFVQARLADVVHRLRASWLAGPALLWGDVHPIRKLAGTDLDQRVATALARGFLQFSQLLAGFEVLVLELKQGGVVSEKRILGIEQLLNESTCRFVDEGRIPYPDCTLSDLPGGTYGRGE